jgi:hypothetical protein
VWWPYIISVHWCCCCAGPVCTYWASAKVRYCKLPEYQEEAHKDEHKVVSSELCAVVKTVYSLVVSSQRNCAAADDHFLPCTEYMNERKAKLNVIKSKTTVARNRSDEFTLQIIFTFLHHSSQSYISVLLTKYKVINLSRTKWTENGDNKCITNYNIKLNRIHNLRHTGTDGSVILKLIFETV